jgi:hypothetical protein
MRNYFAPVVPVFGFAKHFRLFGAAYFSQADMLAYLQLSEPPGVVSTQNFELPVVWRLAILPEPVFAVPLASEPDGLVGRLPLLIALGEGFGVVVGACCASATVMPPISAAAATSVVIVLIAFASSSKLKAAPRGHAGTTAWPDARSGIKAQKCRGARATGRESSRPAGIISRG